MRNPTRLVATGATLTLAVTLLGACNNDGGDAATSSTAPAPTVAETPSATEMPTQAPTTEMPTEAVTSAPTATGPVVSRDKKIRLTLPAGWTDNTAAAGTGVTLSAKSDAVTAGFSPTLLVTAGANPGASLPTLVANSGKKKAEQLGGQFSTAPARTIGGVSAPGYQVTATQDGKKLTHREYYVARSGALYIVTLSASAEDKAADVAFTELLSGWAWA